MKRIRKLKYKLNWIELMLGQINKLIYFKTLNHGKVWKQQYVVNCNYFNELV